MKILLIAMNAKFIHSSLALYSIQRYCAKYKANIKKIELTINHYENEILKSIYEEKPDVLAFSCYIWNMEMISTLIPILSKILPNCKIILGGPEVSFNSEEFFTEDFPIDMIIEGEGEETWYELMNHYVDGSKSLKDIKGIVYKDHMGIIHRNPSREPMDLNKIPFVYDDVGKLDHRIIYYEATRGCPFNCQYCLSSTDKGVRFLDLKRVFSDLQFFIDHKVPQVKFVDRTFNWNLEYAVAIWDYLKKNDNGITNFHFEIAADLLTKEVLVFLKDTRPALFQFEIGVQSTNKEVLGLIQRRMDFEKVGQIVKEIKSYQNIHQHLDLIAGLPKEDMASFRRSFNDVIALGPEQLQLGFLKVLKGSGMHQDAKKYGLVYKDFAPYEILYTDCLSYDEMLQLHAIEDIVERYYNSNRFVYSMKYLFTLFDTPFDAVDNFARFWEGCGYHQVRHSKHAHYDILLEFTIGQTSANVELMQELARFDLFLHEQLKNIPKKLITINQDEYKQEIRDFYHKEDNIQMFLPELKSFTKKQVSRMAHIEVFSYDIPSYVCSPDFKHPVKKITPVLFHYHAKDSLTGHAAYTAVEFDR